jgi:cytochrome P450
VTDLASVDYFSDQAIAQDPYDYLDYLRGQGPVFREPHHGVVAVTGYAEVMAAFKDSDAFSACISIGGPFPPLPFEPEGDDITEMIEAHRHQFPINEHLVTRLAPEVADRQRVRAVTFSAVVRSTPSSVNTLMPEGNLATSARG